MSDQPKLTNAQYDFLRRLRENDLPTFDWPSPAILRKWMRRDTFRRAIESLQEAILLRGDLHVAAIASRAAINLQNHLQNTPVQHVGELAGALRASHQRLRELRQADLRQRSLDIREEHDRLSRRHRVTGEW